MRRSDQQRSLDRTLNNPSSPSLHVIHPFVHPSFLLKLPLQSEPRRKLGEKFPLLLFCCWLVVWFSADPTTLKCAAFGLGKIREFDSHFKEAGTQTPFSCPLEKNTFWAEIKQDAVFSAGRISASPGVSECLQTVSTSQRLLMLHAQFRGAHRSQASTGQRAVAALDDAPEALSFRHSTATAGQKAVAMVSVRNTKGKKVQNMFCSCCRYILIMTLHDSVWICRLFWKYVSIMSDKTPCLYHPSRFSKISKIFIGIKNSLN